MTVQKLFKSIISESEDEFIRFFIEKYNCGEIDSSIKYSKLYDITKNLLESLCKVEKIGRNKDKFVVFSLPCIGNISNHLDSFVVKKDEIENEKAEHYAYELDTMKNILGYDVSKACLHFLDEFTYASSILFEMTFFGYTIIDQEKNVKKEKRGLSQTAKELKEDKGELISFDDFMKKFNFEDKRTDAEKIFDKQKTKIEIKY